MQFRQVHTTTKFEKEVLQAKKRGSDLEKLKEVIDLLVEKKPLPNKLNDHPLKGSWKGYRDLHLEPDWLIIYRADNENLWLARTGSHSDLF